MKNYIATIQQILEGRNTDFDNTAGNCIKFVRHKDKRTDLVIDGQQYNGHTVYTLYKYNRDAFLAYQGEQAKPIFSNVDYIVVFLGERGTSSRFIGVYKNEGVEQRNDFYYYKFVEAEGFDILKEKVIIDWGLSAITWHQYYSSEKYVTRIEEGMSDLNGIPMFKSYSDVFLPYQTLKTIVEGDYEEWHTVLSAVNCVYLIKDKSNGMQYVGKTSGRGGILQRWTDYAKTGHGDDVELMELIAKNPNHADNFYWTILETLPINITDKEAIHRESFWKEKLMSRHPYGYNRN